MHAILVVAAASLFTVSGSALQTSAEKPPQKGDRVVARGCLSGSVLRATETTVVDGAGTHTAAVDFRLTGKKDLLKDMRTKEDGRVVEITGVLKSDLPRPETAGKQIGKTRIVVGVGSRDTMQQQAPPHLPVLEVKSYEGFATSCGG